MNTDPPSQRIPELFARARGLAPEERASFLREACGSDHELREEVEALLRVDTEGAEAFLGQVELGGAPAEDEIALTHGMREPELPAGCAAFPAGFRGYRCVRLLGRGGMGEVFLAEQEEPRRLVAIKLIRRDLLGEGRIRERFRREIEALTRVEHANICTVFESGEIEGQPYVAMRYVEGETLAARLRAAHGNDRAPTGRSSSRGIGGEAPTPSSRADIDAVLVLIEKVARALHEAHEAGVLHRDVKPGNILVTCAGEPMLLDFGLARAVDSDVSALTHTGEHLGTPAYMSPEQLRGGRGPIDRRSDVYSLGVTLFECLTLRQPYLGATYEQLCLEILSRGEARCADLNPAIPRDLRTVVETAMDREPDRRYRTAGEFAEDLRRVRERLPIRAKPIGYALRARRWTQRNPILTAVLCVLVLGLSAFASQWLRAEEEARRAAGSERVAREALEDLRKLAQLSDLEVLVQLRREADTELWPARSDRLPAIRAWLERAEELKGRLREYEGQIASLEAEAYPLETDRLRARAELEALDRLQREVERAIHIADPSEAIALQGPSILQALHADYESKLRAFVVDLSERWSIVETTDQADAIFKAWRYLRLHEIVSQIREFVEGPPLVEGTLGIWGNSVPEVARRSPWIEEWRRESLLTPLAQEAWKKAILHAKTPPPRGRYGMELESVEGLVPLGINRESRLLEFWHVPTGSRPEPASHWTWNVSEFVTDQGLAKPGRRPVAPEEGIVFVLVPGGSQVIDRRTLSFPIDFQLGTDDPNAADDLQVIEQSSFLVSKYELTRQQWCRWRGRHEHRHGDSSTSYPQGGLSHSDAERYAKATGFQLPSVQLWEISIRAGSFTRWWTGESSSSLQGAENLDESFVPWDDGHKGFAPIGSFRANAFGLHDLGGNSAEWIHEGLPVDLPATVEDLLNWGYALMMSEASIHFVSHDDAGSPVPERLSMRLPGHFTCGASSRDGASAARSRAGFSMRYGPAGVRLYLPLNR